MPAKMPDPDFDHLRQMHAARVPVQEIAKRLGVSRPVVCRWLRDIGLPVFTRQDGALIRAERMTRAERLANTQAAQSARRGQVDSVEVRTARALGMTKGRIGMYETETIEHLRQRGVDCEGQYPVGPYNLDILLHESRVAVEIYSTHPGMGRMADIHERCEHLFNRGFSCLTVQVNYPRRVFDLGAVCDKIVSFADLCRRDKPALGHYGVIGGNGKVRARSSHHLIARPSVTGF